MAQIPRVLHRILFQEPVARRSDLAYLALSAGIIAGIARSCRVWLPKLLRGDPREAESLAVLWMGPAASIVVALAVAIALMLLPRDRLSIRIPVVLSAAAALFVVIQSLRLGLQTYALLLLSFGAALQVGRLAARSTHSFRRAIRLVSAVGLIYIAAGAITTTVGFRIAEERRLAGLPAVAGPAPNVLVLVLDTVRAQSLSLYGYARDTAPEISRVAGQGVTFERAIAPTPWTLPSHASMFTGLEPWELSTDFDKKLDGAHPTLAELLSAHGYATAGLVANLIYCTSASGLDRGFATYRDVPLSISSFLNSSVWTRRPTDIIRRRAGIHRQLVRKPAEEVNVEFLSWLDRVGGRPFFAFLNYFDAHSPYETQPSFERRFRQQPPRFWLMGELSRRGYSDELRQEFTDAYDSTIAYVDQQVGRLVGELQHRGVLDNTILVIVSDHGEHLGEHGIFSHGNSLYMPLLHVPLVIRYPRGVPAGRRIAQLVSTRDVAATILEMAGAGSRRTIPGLSLSRYWSDRLADTDEPDGPGILSELTPNEFSNEKDPIQRGHMASLVKGSLHYIRNGDGVEELYDVKVDPQETQDLTALPEWHSALLALRDSMDALRPAGTAGAVPARVR